MRAMRFFASLLVVILTMVVVAAAQEPNATLVGRVTDRLHAAIVDATIQVRNTSTNAVRTGRSEAEGEYTISNLPPGVYEVTIDKQGFKQLHQGRLDLSAAQTARLDAQLEVGAVSETVDVNAEAPLINSETSSRGDVVAPKEIAEIPLNGRDFNDLAFTVAGVSPQEQGGKGFKYVVNGARADASNIIIDGFNDESARDAGAQVSPPLDSIQEFKFQTSGYSAEYGRQAGGTVNMPLKSGGNQLHGALFEYLRNDMFDAKNHFALLGKNKLRQNQFGGTLTGPVMIPGLYNGHDRTFFMVSWESQRRIFNTPTPTLVPTARERMGDFSQTVDAQGNPVKLKSPFATPQCKTFANSKIPAQCINAISQALLKYYPSPNFSSSLIPGKNYLSKTSNTDNYDAFVFKADEKVGEKDNLGVRVIYRPSNQFNPLSGSDSGLFGSTTDHNDAIYGISETRVFTPNLINEFHAALTRSTNTQTSRDAGTNWSAQLGIQGAPLNPIDPAFQVFPNIAITNYATIGDSKTNPVTFTLNAYDVTDGVTWNKGRHNIKIGGEILRVGYFQQTHDQLNGSFSFKKTFTGVPFADFLLGLPDTATIKTAAPTSHIYSPNYAIYVQDDYKVFPKLTLNLGLRYEVAVAPHERNGAFSNFVLSTGKIIIGSAAGVPNLNALLASVGLSGKVGVASDYGLPSSTIRTDYSGIAPRFGFAWRPFKDNGTVVRGGYGIFYTGSRLSAIRTDIAGGFPFANTRQLTGKNIAITDLNFATALNRALLQGLTTASGYDVNAPEPYLQSYNLTVERLLGKGVAIEVGYAGSKGTHLGRKYNINQQLRVENRQLALADGTCPNCPRPVSSSFGDIEFYSWGATSNYNAGIVTLRKQLGKGPTFRVNYTYSKSLDENSGLNYAGDGGFKASVQDSQHLRSEYGRSDFDIRHVFSTSVIYQLPFTRNFLIREWQVSGTATAYSGQPFTPILSNNQDAGQPTRPDRIGNGALSNPTQQRWFDLSAFQDVPLTLFRFGNSGRNILDGPRKMQINMALARNFTVSEHGRLQLRWEAFNLTNHTNLQLPNTDVTPGNQSAGTITKADDGRIMQLGLSYRF